MPQQRPRLAPKPSALDSVFERWYKANRKTGDATEETFKKSVARATKEELLTMLKESGLSTEQRRMVIAKLRRSGFSGEIDAADGKIANWLREHGFAFASPDHAKDTRREAPTGKWSATKVGSKWKIVYPSGRVLMVNADLDMDTPEKAIHYAKAFAPDRDHSKDAASGPARWKTLSRSELLRLKRDIEEDVRRLTEATGGKPVSGGRLSDLKDRLSYLNELLATSDTASGPAREAIEQFYRNAERSGGNAALARAKTKIHFDLSDLKVGSEGNVVSFKVKDRALSKDVGFANLKFEAEDHTASWMVFVTLADGRPYTKINVPKNKAATKAEAIHEAKVMLTSAGRDRAVNRDAIQTTYYQHVGRTHNRNLARLRTMMDHNLKTLTVDSRGQITDLEVRDAKTPNERRFGSEKWKAVREGDSWHVTVEYPEGGSNEWRFPIDNFPTMREAIEAGKRKAGA